MQVHHDEGVANRIDLESCANTREGIGEALTGERIGQPLSRESTLIPGADVVPVTEGNTDGVRSILDWSGRIEARTGLRMMPTFPRSPLSFRTAGFPRYGWKAGFSDGAFLAFTRLSLLPTFAAYWPVCIHPSYTS